ncbi:MAG: RibD family protein, partial [bacterium]
AKAARTLDGRIGTREGQPLRITGPEALEWVGRRRTEVDGVLVGSGTLLADDPHLTARRPGGGLWGHQPFRVVADARLRTGEGARLLTGEGGGVVVLTAPEQVRGPRADGLRERGVRIEAVPAAGEGRGLEPGAMLSTLARLGMASILVEGGAQLLSSLEGADLVDLWQVWVAPRVLGSGRGMLAEPAGPRRLGPMQAVQVGSDLLVTALPEGRHGKEAKDVHRDR